MSGEFRVSAELLGDAMDGWQRAGCASILLTYASRQNGRATRRCPFLLFLPLPPPLLQTRQSRNNMDQSQMDMLMAQQGMGGGGADAPVPDTCVCSFRMCGRTDLRPAGERSYTSRHSPYLRCAIWRHATDLSLMKTLQMLKHGRAGVPMEVMGLMLGHFVDEYTVQVVDVFAMPQSGTTVTVESVDHVFQTKMMEMLKQTNRCVLPARSRSALTDRPAAQTRGGSRLVSLTSGLRVLAVQCGYQHPRCSNLLVLCKYSAHS